MSDGGFAFQFGPEDEIKRNGRVVYAFREEQKKFKEDLRRRVHKRQVRGLPPLTAIDYLSQDDSHCISGNLEHQASLSVERR